MTLIVFLLAISPILCNFAGFLAGQRGDRMLRDKLLAFYVAVQGDWANAYRRPARLVARYLHATFGDRLYLIPVLVAAYSLVTTTLLTTAHLNLTIPGGVDSAGPVLTGDGHFDLRTFWTMYLAPDLVGDLASWPVSLLLFAALALARPWAALPIALAIMLVGLAAFVLVARLQAWEWDFSSVPQSLPDLSLPAVTKDGGFSDEWIRASSALRELGFGTDEFTFDYWGAVPLAVFLPALLLGVTTLVTLALVLAKPLVYRPTLLIVERLDASSKRLLDAISAALVGVAVLVTAVHVLLQRSG